MFSLICMSESETSSDSEDYGFLQKNCVHNGAAAAMYGDPVLKLREAGSCLLRRNKPSERDQLRQMLQSYRDALQRERTAISSSAEHQKIIAEGAVESYLPQAQ